jgi:hypothetical protein
MIIAVGQPTGTPPSTVMSASDLLIQWGRRLWTFPEVLLSPGDEIAIYTRGSEGTPQVISKSQFAVQVWGDALEARQLAPRNNSIPEWRSSVRSNGPLANAPRGGQVR